MDICLHRAHFLSSTLPLFPPNPVTGVTMELGHSISSRFIQLIPLPWGVKAMSVSQSISFLPFFLSLPQLGSVYESLLYTALRGSYKLTSVVML